MTEQTFIFRPKTITKSVSVSALAALAVCISSLPFTPSALAQTGAVTVDLSVIQDGGLSGPGPASRSGLQIPPRTNPVSELHVAPKNAPVLARPAPSPKTTLKAPDQKPASMAKMQEPKTTMPEAPAKAAPKKLDAPAPQAMPAKEVAKAEPIAPPPPPAPNKSTESETMPAKTAEAPMPAKTSDAPPPPPKVAAAPAPAVSAEQANAGAQAIEIAPGRAMQIEFEEVATKLPESMKDPLRKIADGMRDKTDLRLQLMAYAGAEGLSASKARRLSLSRALSVRSFLIESGVRSTRIDVRALGDKTSEAPANRVDINIAKR